MNNYIDKIKTLKFFNKTSQENLVKYIENFLHCAEEEDKYITPSSNPLRDSSGDYYELYDYPNKKISPLVSDDFVIEIIDKLEILLSDSKNQKLYKSFIESYNDFIENQKNINEVDLKIIKLNELNNIDSKALAVSMEAFLNQIAMDDGFGTERQCDPRGDGRDGCFSMSKVQGYAKSKQNKKNEVVLDRLKKILYDPNEEYLREDFLTQDF